jgi:hypothetical protein
MAEEHHIGPHVEDPHEILRVLHLHEGVVDDEGWWWK